MDRAASSSPTRPASLVVTQLATAAGKDSSGIDGTGFTAYANAQLIWGMPQAIITVSVMAALLPRISRAGPRRRRRRGPRRHLPGAAHLGRRDRARSPSPSSRSASRCAPCSSAPRGTERATNMGYILMAFGLGLIPYSVQYVVLRGFYAYEDTRTPFYNTVIVAAVNAAASALCFFVLPPAGPWSAWRPRTAWRTRSASASPGAGCASGSAATWTAPASCGRTPGSCIASRARGAAQRRGLLRHRSDAGPGRRRLARRARRRRSRPARRLLRRRAEDAHRRAQLPWSAWSAGAWGAEAGVRAQPSSAAACRA